MIGTAKGSGEQFIICGAETHYRLSNFPDQLSKEEMESDHLERYRYDCVDQHGYLPFATVHPGDNPPDFVVSLSADDVWGVDCAVFADERRRRASSMMMRLRERLRHEVGERDFSGIQGCELLVRFSRDLDALPPRRNSQDAVIESLLDAMAACRYDRETLDRVHAEMEQNPDRFYEPWPDLGDEASLPDGSGFIANVICPPSESHRLPSGLGFEVKLHMQTTDFVSDLFDRLAKLVTDHDKASIQQLLITAAGPNRDGYCYPEEELTAKFLLQHHPDLQPGAKGLEVKHLRRVTIHSWSSRSVVDIPLTTNAGD